MANAIISGLISAGYAAKNICVSDKDSQKLAEFEKLGVNTIPCNAELEKECGIIILAVKPQIMDSVLAELANAQCAPSKNDDKIYISIAAGVTLAKLENALGTEKKIVRTMPNTPLQVGCGITIICPNGNLTDDEISVVEEIFANSVVRLDEAHINAGMALSASSPAYVYMLIDAMADGGVKHGLPRDVALKLAAKAVEGAGKMVTETGISPEQLKNNVCSPGGTTIEAVQALEREKFAAALHAAIDACVEKGKSLDTN